MTPEQREARRSSLGASEIAAVAGIDPFRGPWDIWAEKMGFDIYKAQRTGPSTWRRRLSIRSITGRISPSFQTTTTNSELACSGSSTW